ncbi:hypothetical protein [Gillisia sp. CAL575]|uniref:hypothetical protein n=1 Tax=Gillisia sp. CAL575 TaxID=985255 RepID=UPI0003A62FEE|nr:hypothetical protein [Gillisia sp. CAL575]
MNSSDLVSKVKRKLWQKTIRLFRKNKLDIFIYRSFWHKKISNYIRIVKGNNDNYFSAVPNPGAGIGHQMANWIAGYWFARFFGLKFAHIPFSSTKWEDFLGFGENEITVKQLVKKQGYKKVLLPLFDETSAKEIEVIEKIITSYKGRKVVFIAEQDQFYRAQHGVIDDLQRKFYSSSSRQNDNLIYSKNEFNVAIHVRRGDIVIGQENQNPNLLMRFQDNAYFEKVLMKVLNNIETEKPVKIYLFSQGEKKDFSEFQKFRNLKFCLDMTAVDSFLHMVYADLLITSKSSFSYKPALLNKGIKVCPRNFWHGYPKGKDWILADDDGTITNLPILC